MRIGLKLWSTNTGAYLYEAQRLYRKGVFDYIELYVVPGSLECLQAWRTLAIPFAIHAPHYDSGVNLADSALVEHNRMCYDEVKRYRDELHAPYIVIHSGIEGNISETIRQLKLINPGFFLIENKPYLGPTDPSLKCRGSTIEECRSVLEGTGCGFCLDFGHAICTANYLKVDPYEYVGEFNKLSPRTYHLSDNDITSPIDAHRHYGDGNYDIARLLRFVAESRDIAIETVKNSKENLDDFACDAAIIRKGGLL